ncbi:hypothetical protein KC19_2G082900 [Ceratodon purpureus]|uniref:Uncharacterized protein n=1 Tax=Ceratodon purpureus TaxID=3225 RepID=A0A8T0IT73_CERPU|nr:hypothetical protein KC19_2G082900 [Ceratodon purpureus]
MAMVLRPHAGMGSFACPAVCGAMDGGAGAWSMSLGTSALWKGGEGGVGGGFSSSGGMRSWFAGQPVEQSGMVRRNQGWQVNVAADHSGSKPEAHKRRGKWGYHPLEELTKHEREAMQAGNGRPSDADIARTITEVNWKAVIYASVVTIEDIVFGTEVQFLVDEHGDFFFEMNDDNEFLSKLSDSQTFTVMIGFGAMDEVQVSEMVDGGEEMDDDEDDDDILMEFSDDSDDEFNPEDVVPPQFWEELAGATGSLHEGLSPESMGSLGGWGGPETLAWVHPLEFATRISQAVTTDHTEEMNKPTKRLTITGVVRRVSEEEEPYVQSLWYDRFWWDEDNDGEEEGDSLVGEDETTKETDKDKGMRTRWKVVTGAPSTSKSGEGKPNPTGMRRTSTKGGVEVDEQRSRNGGLRPSSTSDSINSDADVDDGQDVIRREVRASNIVRDSAGVSSSTDEAALVGSVLEGEILEGEVGDIVEGASVDGGDAVEGEWTEEGTSWDVGTTFYKLEMLSMQLDLNSGLQKSIEIQDFSNGQPDILAHSAAAIIERVNQGGSKTDRALKALCRREKGLEVEEATVVGVDCLGMDLRVSAGIEVQTLRFQFNRKATCEKVADQLIDQLLFPRPGVKRPRKSQPPRTPRRWQS